MSTSSAKESAWSVDKPGLAGRREFRRPDARPDSMSWTWFFDIPARKASASCVSPRRARSLRSRMPSSLVYLAHACCSLNMSMQSV